MTSKSSADQTPQDAGKPAPDLTEQELIAKGMQNLTIDPDTGNVEVNSGKLGSTATALLNLVNETARNLLDARSELDAETQVGRLYPLAFSCAQQLHALFNHLSASEELFTLSEAPREQDGPGGVEVILGLLHTKLDLRLVVGYFNGRYTTQIVHAAPTDKRVRFNGFKAINLPNSTLTQYDVERLTGLYDAASWEGATYRVRHTANPETLYHSSTIRTVDDPNAWSLFGGIRPAGKPLNPDADVTHLPEGYMSLMKTATRFGEGKTSPVLFDEVHNPNCRRAQQAAVGLTTSAAFMAVKQADAMTADATDAGTPQDPAS